MLGFHTGFFLWLVIHPRGKGGWVWPKGRIFENALQNQWFTSIFEVPPPEEVVPRLPVKPPPEGLKKENGSTPPGTHQSETLADRKPLGS